MKLVIMVFWVFFFGGGGFEIPVFGNFAASLQKKNFFKTP